MGSKPYDVCWCDCHMPVDDDGKRIWQNLWPKYDDPTAKVLACRSCVREHETFVRKAPAGEMSA